MKPFVKYSLLCIMSASMQTALAQNVEMADEFRAEGKIYVVVAVVLIVLLGLFAYLFMLDRKITRLERTLRERNQTKAQQKSF